MSSRCPIRGLRLAVALSFAAVSGIAPVAARDIGDDAFRQLEELLPTPNAERIASGAPGPGYWQQRVDYDIRVRLDDEARRLEGSERITYANRSPHELRYLWLQLDPNLLSPESLGALARTAPRFEGGSGGKSFEGVPYSTLRRLLYLDTFDGGMDIGAVRDANGQALEHTVVHTMMRVDLPEPLAAGESFVFEVDWSFSIGDAVVTSARSGFEVFDDGNTLYEMAQWFPRLAAYTDVNGWQHKQFLGRGEFTLDFGDYRVEITTPADHVVASTGVLQNPEEVLTATQRERLEQARTADAPVFVVTPEEAAATAAAPRQSTTRVGERTWIYEAEDVRDFAWASSRKFIWDAWVYEQGDDEIWAMSYYPNEAEPLWSTYSTHAIVHTLEVYSRYTFDYPYPVAISVNGPVGGMEYPMICFNGPRTEDDGTYYGKAPRGGFRLSKYGLISVIIHEVGHNYFPMIVNSDERQWTWMDEGLNTFLQSLAEGEWEEDYPSSRGEPEDIVEYMLSENQVPIMTNSESILQFGANAYAKPATALNVLRETILGRELFDFAFREYARRWKFKRPQPADFFRTMEDASGMDLDWFWRGWFYSTDHVDIGLERVRLYSVDSLDPEIEKARQRAERDAEPTTKRQEGFAQLPKRVDRYPELRDFYNDYDELEVVDKDRADFDKALEALEPWERELLGTDLRFYVLDFENVGGLAMPILLRIETADGETKDLRIPAEIWRSGKSEVSKLLLSREEIVSIEVDPQRETADADRSNNLWPPRPEDTRFRLYKREMQRNPMQQAAGPAADDDS